MHQLVILLHQLIQMVTFNLTSASGADIVEAHMQELLVFIDGHTDATGATISTASSVFLTFKGQIIFYTKLQLI